ncbi:hypothetical protein TWF481_002576 [Arthrobotrys musiformis]|uniref:Uncharacterized protein n=1 Tax=Arthrobotrys musiformis TaxID=47236 RepID=A0AAV9VRT2_9PEZI
MDEQSIPGPASPNLVADAHTPSHPQPTPPAQQSTPDEPNVMAETPSGPLEYEPTILPSLDALIRVGLDRHDVEVIQSLKNADLNTAIHKIIKKSDEKNQRYQESIIERYRHLEQCLKGQIRLACQMEVDGYAAAIVHDEGSLEDKGETDEETDTTPISSEIQKSRTWTQIALRRKWHVVIAWLVYDLTLMLLMSSPLMF